MNGKSAQENAKSRKNLLRTSTSTHRLLFGIPVNSQNVSVPCIITIGHTCKCTIDSFIRETPKGVWWTQIHDYVRDVKAHVIIDGYCPLPIHPTKKMMVFLSVRSLYNSDTSCSVKMGNDTMVTISHNRTMDL